MFYARHDVESRSSIGVDEVSLDELNMSKLAAETESLLGILPEALGTLGGVINFPLAT